MMGPGVISAWRELLGPTDSAEARKVAPQSIRARFGKGLCSIILNKGIVSFFYSKTAILNTIFLDYEFRTFTIVIFWLSIVNIQKTIF